MGYKTMKINGYTLKYDPEGLDETNEADILELSVPYKGTILYDQNTIKQTSKFSVTLYGNEIEDIIGMWQTSRTFYIDYKHYVGFFYATKFDISWIKDYNTHRVISVDIEGYFLGKSPYFKLTYFVNPQKLDFDVPTNVVVTLPQDYTSKGTNWTSTTIPGIDSDVSKMVDYDDNEIFFKGSEQLFCDGACWYKDGTTYSTAKRFYKDKIKYDSNVIWVSNNLLKFKITKADANRLLDVYAYDDTFICTITDGLGSLTDSDITLKNDMFYPQIKLNHLELELGLNRYHIELLKSRTNLEWTQKRFLVPTHYLNTVGSMVLTTQNPAPMVLDRNIGGTLPTMMNYYYTPGFIHFNEGEGVVFVSFTNNQETQPTTGIWGESAGRHYLMFLKRNILYSPKSEWTVSGSWTSMTDGVNYNGVANYSKSSSTTAYLEANKTLPYVGTDIKYDIYLMVKNCTTGTGSFKWNRNGADIRTISFGASQQNAYFVHIDSYTPTDANESYRVYPVSGTMGFFYMLIVPTLQDTIGGALSDTRQSYGVE